MKISILPITLLLVSAPCFGADDKNITIGISDGSGRVFTRKATTVGEEKTTISTIRIYNKTPHKLVARVEGFGVIDTNSQREEYKLVTGGVNIPTNATGVLQRPTTSMQFPIKSVLYQLYASALMVRVAGEGYGDINTEAYFTNPFDHGSRKSFIVTGDQFDDGRYQLEIELAKE